MKNTQAWGWLAAGVLALGLNGIYHDGGAAWAHCALGHVVSRIEQRTGPVLALATGRADLFLARTKTAVARDETASCRLATTMARVQTRMARTQNRFANLEVMSAREEAALARLEANRARMEAQVARVRFSPVAFHTVQVPNVCPRIRVSIPRVTVPQVSIPGPTVETLEALGTGPI